MTACLTVLVVGLHMIMEGKHRLWRCPIDYVIVTCSRQKLLTTKQYVTSFFMFFGLMHTQTRWDRNQYVNVNTKNLVDSKEARYQYEICEDCDTLDAPYECNSIMHYEDNTFAIDPKKPVMTSINKSCIIKPSYYLTNEDWKLLNKAAKCPKI